MIAVHLKPRHIGKQFRAKADGIQVALTGGLSDYWIRKNRGGAAVEVIVWINGSSLRLRPDSTITPIENQGAAS